MILVVLFFVSVDGSACRIRHPALGFAVLGERVSPRGVLGLAMGFSGILVITAGQLAGPRTGDDFVLGIVYIVLAAAGVTVGNVVFRRLAGTAMVFWLWLTVLETVELYRANAFSFLIPVLGLTLGVVFYDEALTATLLAGIAVTVAGIYLVNVARPAGGADPGEREGEMLPGSRGLT